MENTHFDSIPVHVTFATILDDDTQMCIALRVFGNQQLHLGAAVSLLRFSILDPNRFFFGQVTLVLEHYRHYVLLQIQPLFGTVTMHMFVPVTHFQFSNYERLLRFLLQPILSLDVPFNPSYTYVDL